MIRRSAQRIRYVVGWHFGVYPNNPYNERQIKK